MVQLAERLYGPLPGARWPRADAGAADDRRAPQERARCPLGVPNPPIARRLLPTAPTPQPRGAGPTILVVEPHPPLGEMLRDALRDEGYRPVLAASLPQAAARLHGERFDLVLADPLRPEHATTGQLTRPWSHLEALRALAGDSPIVICTAYSAWAFADYRRRGYRDLLLKPFTLHDLLATVRRTLAADDGGEAAPEGGASANHAAQSPGRSTPPPVTAPRLAPRARPGATGGRLGQVGLVSACGPVVRFAACPVCAGETWGEIALR